MHCTKHLVPSNWYQVLGTRWYQVLGTSYVWERGYYRVERQWYCIVDRDNELCVHVMAAIHFTKCALGTHIECLNLFASGHIYRICRYCFLWWFSVLPQTVHLRKQLAIQFLKTSLRGGGHMIRRRRLSLKYDQEEKEAPLVCLLTRSWNTTSCGFRCLPTSPRASWHCWLFTMWGSTHIDPAD